jgi:hypothetical protein
MPREEQSQPYERRILDTKGLAQRLDLNYLGRRHWLRSSRSFLMWIVFTLTVLTLIPIVAGRAGGKALSPGPVINGHVALEKNCSSCHTRSFEPVRDEDCRKCHEGSPHHSDAQRAETAGASPDPGCAECHQEHQGNRTFSDIADENCTRCHADLSRHGNSVNLLGASRRITRFAWGSHPRFFMEQRPDARPLKLNHAVHMALLPGALRAGMKLPMTCTDCHQKAPASTAFEMVPVNFDMHCAGCHAKELAFDVDQVLETDTGIVPHLKEARAIRDYVYNAYRRALQKDPSLWRKPGIKGKAFAPANAATWLDAVAGRATGYLLQRKCVYCHEVEAAKDNRDMHPTIRKVNQISGQYSADRREGVAWFGNAQFSHRMHRTTECETCHTAARKSVKTSEVLIPDMTTCLPCHGSSGTFLDRCAECHVYHDRSQKAAREFPVGQEILRRFTPIPSRAQR